MPMILKLTSCMIQELKAIAEATPGKAYVPSGPCRAKILLPILRLRGLIVLRGSNEQVLVTGEKGPGWDLTDAGRKALHALHRKV